MYAVKIYDSETDEYMGYTSFGIQDFEKAVSLFNELKNAKKINVRLVKIDFSGKGKVSENFLDTYIAHLDFQNCEENN